MHTPEDVFKQRGHEAYVNGITIHYRMYGDGKPLLLLHAGSLSSDMWLPYLGRLAERYSVVMPDMPGHGRSSMPKQVLSYRQLAEDIVAFIHFLHFQGPIVVGFSDGAQVALEIGMRHPNVPRALAIGGAWFKYSDAYRAFVREALGDERSPDVDTALLARSHPSWAGWLDEIYGPSNWKSLLVELKRMWTTPLNYTAEDFSKVIAPTLIFVGDRDELVPVEEAAEMCRQLKNSELAVVPDANHSAFFSTRVAAFQSQIQDFLLRKDS